MYQRLNSIAGLGARAAPHTPIALRGWQAPGQKVFARENAVPCWVQKTRNDPFPSPERVKWGNAEWLDKGFGIPYPVKGGACAPGPCARGATAHERSARPRLTMRNIAMV